MSVWLRVSTCIDNVNVRHGIPPWERDCPRRFVRSKPRSVMSAVLSSHSLHIKKNVLIGEDGKAFICGFDLSEFENVCRRFSDVIFLTLKNVSLFS